MAKFRVGPPAPSAGHRADLPVLAGPLRHPEQARAEEDLLGVWGLLWHSGTWLREGECDGCCLSPTGVNVCLDNKCKVAEAEGSQFWATE